MTTTTIPRRTKVILPDSHRDPFGRRTFEPTDPSPVCCDWCGSTPAYLWIENPDAGRPHAIGSFCSWSCGCSFHDLPEFDDEDEVATCDNCGEVEHTPTELAVCIDSALGDLVDGEDDDDFTGVMSIAEFVYGRSDAD